MNPKTMTLLTGLLSISLGAGAVYPAVAGTSAELPEGETLISQNMMGDPYRATVRIVRNNVVTLELPDGELRQIEFPSTLDRTALLPGKEILVYPDGTVALYESMMETEVTASTTIDEIRAVFERINSRERTTTTVITPEPTPVRTMPTTTQPAPTPVRVETPTNEPVRALW